MAKAEKKEAPRYVSKSMVKDYISGKGLRTSGELLDQIDQWFEDGVLKPAVERCKSNNRGTVRPSDL